MTAVACTPRGVDFALAMAHPSPMGAMMGLSLITIPLFLDTNTQSAHMLTQWVRLYHYGHLYMPSMAIAILHLRIHGDGQAGFR